MPLLDNPRSNGQGPNLQRVVWVFVALVVALLGFASLSMNGQAMFTAYIAAESQWSKAQKQAAFALARYVSDGEAAELERFHQSLSVNLGYHQARLAMNQDPVDERQATQGMLQGGSDPRDVPGMIWAYQHLGFLPNVARAVEFWAAADQQIEALLQLAQEIQAGYAQGKPTPAEVNANLVRLRAIDRQLQPLEDGFSLALAAAARRTRSLLMYTLVTGSSVLLLAALLFSNRLVRNNALVQRRLFEGEEQLRQVLQVAPLPIIIVRLADESVVYANQHGMRQFAIVAENLSRIRASEVYVNRADRVEFMTRLQRDGHVNDYEVQLRNLAGHNFWALLSSQRLRYGGEECLLSALVDITERRRLEDELSYRAHHDPLTGLPNRAMFSEAMQRALARIRRKGGQCALIFIDLDDFKTINDRFGHANGDLLLQQVATRIQSGVRASDLVARLAGDEFVVLIEDPTDRTQVQAIADKILSALRQPYPLTGASAQISASMGISSFPRDGDDPDNLLHAADLAMYQAKAQGKDNVQYAS